MRHTFLLLLTIMVTPALADSDWKVIASISDPACPEEVQILAKEGESFVYAVAGSDRSKLLAQDGSAFRHESMKSTIFSSDTKEKRHLGEPTYTFTQPSYVEGNPPKLDIIHSGSKKHCRMNLKP
jgi:hypothetical protein